MTTTMTTLWEWLGVERMSEVQGDTFSKIAALGRPGLAANRTAKRSPLIFTFCVAMVRAGGVDRTARTEEHITRVGAIKDLPAERVGEGLGEYKCKWHLGHLGHIPDDQGGVGP